MAVVEGSRFGSRGGARIPSDGDVLVAAIGLVLTGAGLLDAATSEEGHMVGTGFLAIPVTGAAHPCVSVTWHEDGEPSGGDPDGSAGQLQVCEQALRRAGYHVEYTAEINGGCLLASRIRRYA